MAAQVREHIDKCHPCLTFKAKQLRPLLETLCQQSPRASPPGIFVPRARGGKRGKCPGGDRPLHLLSPGICHPIPDYPDNSQGPLDNFIVHYGLPRKILLDHVTNFKREMLADLCRLMGTMKLRTSLYHPQTNGQCERFNSTLIGMLVTLPPLHKSDWKGSIGALVHAYNCSQNSATGFSPYFLVYGRQHHLPIDFALGLDPNLVALPTSTKYVQKIRECIRWAIR